MSGVSFSVVFGVVRGYYHDNASPQAHEVVSSAWMVACEQERVRSGYVIGGFVSSGLTAYPKELGCPNGGEVCAIVQGSSNPKFLDADKFDDYVKAVTRVADAVRTALGQSTALVSFTGAQHVRYLTEAAS